MTELQFRDRWEYRPTKGQWESDQYMQHVTYSWRKFFAYFEITSARWDRLARQNKAEAMNDE